MSNKWINSFVVIIFTLMIAAPGIQAESPLVSSSRIEGVLVVDVSKSMDGSDPSKISNEAMKMFIDMSSVKGDKIGVVAYTDQVEAKKEIVKLSSQQERNDLKNFIDSLKTTANTDLSVGINEAIKDLEKSHEQDYRPFIVLLADGNNDVNEKKGRTIQQATEDLNAAVVKAKEKGFPIYVIGLNANGELNKDTLQNIADTTNGKVFETKNAGDLPGILSQIFADHLKLKIVPVNKLTGNGDFQDSVINIPNNSVIEANIALMSDQPVEMKLVDPKGQEVPIPSDKITLTHSNSYAMLKLIQPVQGDWTLRVKGFPKDNVDINLIFNYDLQLKLGPIDAKSLKDGEIVKVAAFFEDNGKKVVNKELYQTMKTTLLVKDLDKNKTEEIQLKADEQGFAGEFKVGDSIRYEIVVKTEGDSFFRETAPQKFSIEEKVAATTTSETNKPVDLQLFPWLYYWAAGIAVALLLTIILRRMIKRKKENRAFTGQILVEIEDETIGDYSNPQCKILRSIKGEFSLRQLFKLGSRFSDTDQIIFLPITDNALLFFNKSNCRIEMNGAALDEEKYHRFKRNDTLHIFMQDSNQSIIVRIIGLDETRHTVSHTGKLKVEQ